MALNFHPLLKKGTYHRVRGFQAHVKANPGTWYGIDDGCVVGTQGYAPEDGKVTNKQKISTGGGWNFRFYPTKYPGYFFWLAHNSALPTKTTYKRGEKMFKTGATGTVFGPHLHYSLLKGSTPIDPDKVVKWEVKEVETDVYKDTSGIFNVTLSAAGWNKSAVRYYKDYKATLAKLNSVTKKVKDLEASIDKKILTATADASRQYQTLINQQTQKFFDLQGELEGCRDRGVELTTEVENLKGQLNIAVEPDKPAIPRVRATDGFWTRAWKRVLQGIAK